jgi:hypothetical protein
MSFNNSIPTNSSGDTNLSKQEIAFIVGIFFFFVILLGGITFYYYFKQHPRKFYIEISDAISGEPKFDSIDFQNEEFVLKNVLGRGSFGTVWSCVFPHKNSATYGKFEFK